MPNHRRHHHELLLPPPPPAQQWHPPSTQQQQQQQQQQMIVRLLVPQQTYNNNNNNKTYYVLNGVPAAAAAESPSDDTNVNHHAEEDEQDIVADAAAKQYILHCMHLYLFYGYSCNKTVGREQKEGDYGSSSSSSSSSVPFSFPPLLDVTNYHPPYCNVVFRKSCCSIRGGKGGFGTLLKGQSRKASAQATTNFGSCRDLQGRRLQHVNDELHYQLWKQWQNKVDSGTATIEEMANALTTTNTGIAGWHLPIPKWSEVSDKKQRQQNKYLLKKFAREQQQRRDVKQQKRELYERQVTAYVQQTDNVTNQLQNTLDTALQQGLSKQQEAKRVKTTGDDAQPPKAFWTLAGDDVVLEQQNRQKNGDGPWSLQSRQSNFCSVGILLDPTLLVSSLSKTTTNILYWEIQIQTSGIVQMGWANITKFRPNSELGDGVGDCKHSYGFDGSRNILLHSNNNNEATKTTSSSSSSYGGQQPWKSGDIVGSWYNRENGTISYSINGQDLGVAFEVGIPTAEASNDGTPPILFPAVSCNPGEIIELHVQPSDCSFLPSGMTTVGDVLATGDDCGTVLFAADDVATDSSSQADNNQDDVMNDTKPPAVQKMANDEELPASKDLGKLSPANQDADNQQRSEDQDRDETKKEEAKPQPPDAAAAVVEALPLENLDKYESVEELEKLGLDRLKSALMAAGLKCGGTLQERAQRLFAVRGLESEQYPTKLLAKKKKKQQS